MATVTLTIPVSMHQQKPMGIFDPGVVGYQAVNVPALATNAAMMSGGTITLPLAFIKQAIDAGFTVSSYTPG